MAKQNVIIPPGEQPGTVPYEITDGPYAPCEQYIGGLTIIDVVDDERARYWAGRIAEACGWPQETRRVW